MDAVQEDNQPNAELEKSQYFGFFDNSSAEAIPHIDTANSKKYDQIPKVIAKEN